MARITLKGSFEDWEVIDNCTVVLDDYADTETEKDFIGLKIDNTKKQNYCTFAQRRIGTNNTSNKSNSSAGKS